MKYAKPIAFTALLIFSVTAQNADAQEKRPWASTSKTAFTPEIHHPNVAGITLFAQNPDIVTPIGVAVAPDGRVFVQENHTHKRDSDYEGPQTDRILVFEDSDGDGVADKRSVFYEGHTFSTDLLFGPDGHLYVSTRWFVGRFRDAATKQRADGEPEKLIVCETDGDYPHNGVGGLAIDPARPDRLAFGFGENLGADYTFVGSDGRKLSGGAEGGSTYLCRTDGSELTRQSTGHWNAFGMSYDLKGNLFSTDNDPNATPPNRLLHVVSGADFGYEYRYGRSGRHPLVCWFGEHPGTLGMIGALGEAACGLISHGPEQLLSASWTDNRIDLHSLKASGSSFVATREAFISGPDDFRPVHFSYTPDGQYLYVTDWVSLSYPVHGNGRIWRIEFKQPVSLEPLPRDNGTQILTGVEAVNLLGSDDPYLRTRAVDFLAEHPQTLTAHDWRADTDPVARAHAAVALKRLDPVRHADIIPAVLQDTDQEVRFVGIKWIADERLQQYQPELQRMLDRGDLSRHELRALVAALARITEDSQKEFSPDETLLDLALDAEKSPSLRAMALQGVNSDHTRLTVDALKSLLGIGDDSIRREAVRLLAVHEDPAKAGLLVEVAIDTSIDAELRADAIAGLAGLAAEQSRVLEDLVQDDNEIVSEEAERTLASAGLVARKLQGKPPVDDLAAWQALVNQATKQADTAVGRRLFFHAKLGGCYNCHAMNGRGRDVGPDLTTIRNQSGITQEWLLRHVVNPDSEMAPNYRPQQILTVDGRVLTGLILGREGAKQAYVGTDGVVFFVDKQDVEERRELTTSIMPTGLLDDMSADEIRDLIAYLLQASES